MNYENCTSSLIFGVQWDLALKYIETKGATTKENLTTDSKNIGNYNNNLWNISNTKAKYSIDYGGTFTACPYEKKSNGDVLVTTGSDTSFSLMNIYDLAGNQWEWTLELYTSESPCVYRGGNYCYNGSDSSAKSRGADVTNAFYGSVSFRVALWK